MHSRIASTIWEYTSSRRFVGMVGRLVKTGMREQIAPEAWEYQIDSCSLQTKRRRWVYKSPEVFRCI